MTTRKKRKLYERFLVLEVSVVEYETPGEYCVIIGNEKVCGRPFLRTILCAKGPLWLAFLSR